MVIERNHQSFAVLRAATPIRRTISECIAVLSPESNPTIDAEFSKDVQAVIASHREALEAPAWD